MNRNHSQYEVTHRFDTEAVPVSEMTPEVAGRVAPRTVAGAVVAMAVPPAFVAAVSYPVVALAVVAVVVAVYAAVRTYGGDRPPEDPGDGTGRQHRDRSGAHAPAD